MSKQALHAVLKHALKRKSGRKFRYLYRQLRGERYLIRISVVCLGILFLLIGLVMIITPGPGLVFILLGLGCMTVISSRLAFWLDRLEVYCWLNYKSWRAKRRRSRHYRGDGKGK